MATGKAIDCQRFFTPVEISVFDTVVEQRNKNDGEDPFVYSVKEGLETLKNNGNAAKYGIGTEQIRNTIQELANEGIIDADWVTRCGGGNPRAYEFAHHSVGHIYTKYGVDAMLFDDIEESDKVFFIDITFKRIKTIRDSLVPRYACDLSCDETGKRFIVKCSEIGAAFTIKRINYTGRAAKVFTVALVDSPNKPITRGDLKQKRVNVMGESLATKVFDDNSVVRNELRPFVKGLTSDSITVCTSATLTRLQLLAIKKASFLG